MLFLTTSDDERVWFTEWASNKVAYIDTLKQVPFEEQVQQKSIMLTKSSEVTLSVSMKSTNDISNFLPRSQVEVGLTGMTESGLMGVNYQANPPNLDLQKNASGESIIQLKTQDNARPGSYIVMVKAQAPEQDGLIISRLYPVKLVLDIPQPTIQTGESGSNSQVSAPFEIRDLIRVLAIAAVIGLIGFVVYRRVKRKPTQS